MICLVKKYLNWVKLREWPALWLSFHYSDAVGTKPMLELKSAWLRSEFVNIMTLPFEKGTTELTSANTVSLPTDW